MKFRILGGDVRFEMLEEMLTAEGHTVDRHENITILPLPVTRDGVTLNAPRENGVIQLSDIVSTADEGDIFIGGMLPDDFAARLKASGAIVFDYNAREDFTLQNAELTAEGAVALAVYQTDFAIMGTQCLVTGGGRIGKALSRRLAALGADVTMSARKASDFDAAEQMGIKHIHSGDIAQHIADYPLVFNTVPARIFGDAEIDAAARCCVYIELASSPYGIDFDAAKAGGIRVVNAPSLPAKTAPRAAAENIKNAVFSIIREEFT